MISVIAGSDTFETEVPISLISIDPNKQLSMAGPIVPGSSVIWVVPDGGVALLNAEIKDADGEVVLSMSNNVIDINKDNIYNVNATDHRIIVTNKYGETALDLRNDAGVFVLHADFYHNGVHVVATDEGTTINPHDSAV